MKKTSLLLITILLTSCTPDIPNTEDYLDCATYVKKDNFFVSLNDEYKQEDYFERFVIFGSFVELSYEDYANFHFEDNWSRLEKDGKYYRFYFERGPRYEGPIYTGTFKMSFKREDNSFVRYTSDLKHTIDFYIDGDYFEAHFTYYFNDDCYQYTIFIERSSPFKEYIETCEIQN